MKINDDFRYRKSSFSRLGVWSGACDACVGTKSKVVTKTCAELFFLLKHMLRTFFLLEIDLALLEVHAFNISISESPHIP